MALKRMTTVVGAVGVATLALLAAPEEAQACGGTFCDGQVPGPQQMPVDQTGENILFVIDGGKVEAHIQIQYEGDPDRFGWIIPVTATPEVGVGSQALFDNLLQSTVPTFTLTTQQEQCDEETGASFSLGCGGLDDGAAFGDGGDGSFSTGAGTNGGDGDGDEGGGPEIIDRGFAGAFQFDVLKGGTVEGVVEWLDEAGYVQDDDAPPILAEYLEEDFLFVAIKLRSGAGVEEIHPLTITYDGMEPCVPIRLTAIAAVPDMGIRAFFLGDNRVAPKNYQHVTLNMAQINWLGIPSGLTGYNGALAQAVDEADDGHGFVTEYAGPSAIVGQQGLANAAWSSEIFVDAEWTDVIPFLEGQGLVNCFGECSYPHPMIKSLLEEFFPPPYNVDPEDFWSCPECYQPVYDEETWDGPAFAAALEERIIGPGEHAIDILDDNDYLTRMFTTISPEEMTEDPLFHENPDLPAVPKDYGATRWRACSSIGGPDWLELPDGRVVAVDASQNTMPGIDGMAFAEKLETIPETGAPMEDESNTDEINELVDEFNEDFEIVETGGCNGCKVTGGAEGVLFVSFVFGAAALGRRRRS